jgi:PAS domain-containing protein
MQGPQEMELWRYLESQRELAARLIEGDSLDQVAPGFLEIVADLLDWRAGALWEVTGADEPLRLVHGQGTEKLDTNLLDEARRSGAIALASDALAIPIPTGSPQSVLAVAGFQTTAFDPRSEELIGLLGGFADQLGTFVARRRAEAGSADAERFRNHLAEVVRGTQDAVLSKDLDGVVTSWNPARSQRRREFGCRTEYQGLRGVADRVDFADDLQQLRILGRRVRGGEGVGAVPIAHHAGGVGGDRTQNACGDGVQIQLNQRAA